MTRLPIETEAHGGVVLFAYDFERDDDYIVAAVGFRATGEIREQTVKAADYERVRESTVRRRMERLGMDSTPHKLVG